MKRRFVIASAVCAAVLAAWWLTPDGTEPGASTAGAPPVPASPAVSPASTAPFVRSMDGTQPDGDLQIVGGVLPYGELRRMFDYYLSAQGEQGLAAITQQIRREIDQRLGAQAAPAGQRILDLYLAYKTALVEVEKSPDVHGNAIQAIRRRLEAVQDLRARYFTEVEVQGLFGLEDAYDRDAVARLEISQDTGLTAQQKQQRLAALDAALPEALRAERNAVHAVTTVEQQVLTRRAQGASDDEIYRLRTAAFDAQAASRLAEVDREEAAWKARIAHYRQERDRLVQSQAQSAPADREQALAQLQQSLFTEAERPRLVAYE